MRGPVSVCVTTPIVMYWPASKGVGSPSNRTQNEARDSVSSSRRTRLALYCGASASMVRGSTSSTRRWYPCVGAARPRAAPGALEGARAGAGRPGGVRGARAAGIAAARGRPGLACDNRATMTTTAPAPVQDRPHQAAKRYIYAWGEGSAEGNGEMKGLLGGKGAGLAEMTRAGLPTPPGFTITTEACNDYFAAGGRLPDGLWDDVLEAMREVERRSGKGFGDTSNPLLVSVRSGAKFSMPGMMDTVLNLGLNEETLNGLIALTGNERFGWDAYRRFIQMFGRIVMDVKGERFDHALEERKRRHGERAQDTDLTVEDLKALVEGV